jgi:hypothetical protein
MSTTSGDDRRPTKAERKEQARLERERLQREMASKKKRRNLGIALVAIAIVAVVALVALLPSQSDALPTPADLLEGASAAATEAGCTEVRTIAPYDPQGDDRAHVGPDSSYPAMPPLDTYPSTPPASGPHNQTPLRAGVYDTPPPIDQVIHSMEHGGAVIWYDPTATGPELDRLREFYGRRVSEASVGQDRVIVAPFDYPDQGPAGQLPDGAQMALVAWHRERTCSAVDLAAAFDFTSRFGFPTVEGREYEGEAPEPGAGM